MHRLGKGFQRDEDDKREHKAAAQEALKDAEEAFASGKYDLIILDEINYAVKFDLLSVADIKQLLAKRPAGLHVVLTGREAEKEIIDMADLVTEMTLIKHPYQKGIKAQKGIEF